MERRGLLDAAMSPGDESEIKRLVAALLTGFGGTQTAPDAVRLSLALYVSALKRFPLWAVAEACRRFTDGTSETGVISAFAPSPPQFAEEVRRIVEPWLAERGHIVTVLNAKVFCEATPEERARVDRVVAELKESLAASAPEVSAADKRQASLNRFVEASDRLAARDCLAASLTPDARVSPGLAKKLAEMRAEMSDRSYPEAAE
jgi:hypothetical protein